jgi:hypothetical protein
LAWTHIQQFNRSSSGGMHFVRAHWGEGALRNRPLDLEMQFGPSNIC